MLSLPHLPYIKSKDQRIYETIKELADALKLVAQQAGISPSGRIPPPQIQSISVAAANGIFHVSIVDNSANHLGISYFIEYADNQNFNNAKTVALGPSRDKEGMNFGNRTLYFRAFSQYQNSDPSPRVNYGGLNPIGVAGGGSAPPTSLATQGSGSGSGGGYGKGQAPRQLPTRIGLQ